MKKYSSIVRGSYRNTTFRKRRFLFLLAVGLVIVGLLLPKFFSQLSTFVMYPFHLTTAWVKGSDKVLPTYLRSKSELAAELEDLRRKVASESATHMSVNRLLQENVQLRNVLAMDTENTRIVAGVIARPSSLVYDVFQIDRGFHDGVVVGSLVFSGLDSVIGVVTHTAAKYAFVELFTSPGFESTSYVLGPNVFSVIEGMGGGVARVRLPQGVSLEEGQLVLLPGIYSGVYGEVAWVDSNPTQPEQYGYVVPATAVNNIFYVSIEPRAFHPKEMVVIKENIKEEIKQKLRVSEDIVDKIKDSLIKELDGVDFETDIDSEIPTSTEESIL